MTCECIDVHDTSMGMLNTLNTQRTLVPKAPPPTYGMLKSDTCTLGTRGTHEKAQGSTNI